MSLHSPQGLTFWCHNIGRSHSSWLALLSEWGESGPDVVLIQEPPWVQVGRALSLSSPEGDKIFGLPSSPGFHISSLMHPLGQLHRRLSARVPYC